MDAHSLFERLELSDLHAFVNNGQEENLHLDFKLLTDSALNSSDDKKNLARALSGFANSSGGLIVWGIDARKNPAGVDCAIGLKPIERLSLLITRLNSLTGDAADPTVAGVLHRAIEIGRDQGFALTYIPESEGGPHMAKLGDDRYYKRAGDSFYKMEHYDISDMFGRRRRPKLRAFYRVTGDGGNTLVHVGIENEGRATARAPFIAFSCEGPLKRDFYGLDGNRGEGLTYMPFANSGYMWAYSGGMDVAIHPTMRHPVAALSFGVRPRPAPTTDIEVNYAIACEDQSIEHGVLVIPIVELR